MKTSLQFLLLLFTVPSCAQEEVPNKEYQLAIAVLAAPEELRSDATIRGFDKNGEEIELKKGSNDLICRSDDPNKPGFECVCYHKDLNPFMTRGRELKKLGKGGDEIFTIREEEAKAGNLVMPKKPSTLHVLYGGENVKFNDESGEIEGTKYRYVIYIPWATQATTGLPLKPQAAGHPWLMDPGTHRAHIMVTPVYE